MQTEIIIMATFKHLGVEHEYIQALKELGIKYPSDIQEKAIPVLLKSKTDFVGLAQTGTGKTAAFGLPMLQNIDPNSKHVQALILAPTRELVQQIKKQLFKFTKYCEAKIFVEGVYGGEKIDIQIQNLKRTTHVIVATPGRLNDLLDRKVIDLRKVNTVILDEADEMLSMGFKDALTKILDHTPTSKNTWLFSATIPSGIQHIIDHYMSPKAVRVVINKNELVNANISHTYITTTIDQKQNVILGLLEARPDDRGIIFCRTKAGTNTLTEFLKEEGFSVEALEGDMQQRDREKVMRAFKKGNLQVLISTDVSARGIDVNDLAFVLHHQLPEHIEYYTHRSGRTARAGKTGQSIALILGSELKRIHEMNKELGIKFKEISI